MPPQLPPRRPSDASFALTQIGSIRSPPLPSGVLYLTPHVRYSHSPNHPYLESHGIEDPRSSSTQSLRPNVQTGDSRRKLLLVYIHGFLGSEASFYGFPAHVHSLLTAALADSHIVHTKIYPRYQSRRDMTLVRDDFGNWLAPHESSTTDVVLLGHSIGGILGAEVVLEPSHTSDGSQLFQHRILGLVAFDTPFLGMHPGVVTTGLASLFRGAPEETATDVSQSVTSDHADIFNTSGDDPNYNPAYTNDVTLPVRKNTWERAWYFWNKHAGDLGKATKAYVKSHFDFGGCLADYPGLKRRYHTLRALEDVDGLAEKKGPNGRVIPRVRFVNYYTASTGRIKEQKAPVADGQLVPESGIQERKPGSNTNPVVSAVGSSTLHRPSWENQNESQSGSQDLAMYQVPVMKVKIPSIQHESIPSPTLQSNTAVADNTDQIVEDMQLGETLNHGSAQNLKSETASSATVTDNVGSQTCGDMKSNREQTVPAGEEAAKQPQPTSIDSGPGSIVQITQQDKDELRKRLERQSTLNPEDYERHWKKEIQEGRKPGDSNKKDRKFCSLPEKDPTTGAVDSTWIRVYMEGVDEVVAHTSLFIIGETYAKLVGDVTDRIRDWAQEDATVQALLLEKQFGELSLHH